MTATLPDFQSPGLDVHDCTEPVPAPRAPIPVPRAPTPRAGALRPTHDPSQATQVVDGDPTRPITQGVDPATIRFTSGVLEHARLVGFTLEQMQAALRDPRWVNHVYSQPEPEHQLAPRYRYCGHGVAVIVEGHTAIAVIADDETKTPGQRQSRTDL